MFQFVRPARVAGRVTLLFALLGASLVLAAAPTPGAAGVPASHTPTDDTYVNSSSPNNTYGKATRVRTDGEPVLYSFLRFDLGAAPGATTAAIEFRAESRSSAGFAIHAVPNTDWTEQQLTWNTAPALGPVVATTGPLTAGMTYVFDVSAAVSNDPDGVVALAFATAANTAIAITSREGAQPPELMIPAPAAPTFFTVSRQGAQYRAEGDEGTVFTGPAKFVVESAVHLLNGGGGGTVSFGPGVFDLGADYFKFHQISHITFEGQGIDQTVIQNSSDVAADTEPFNFSGAFFVTIRDLTVAARGTPRTTSDALDFDDGNDSTVERVKIVASRARGIVFDGKNTGWDSLRNRVIDCVIQDVPGDGIEFLASSQNEVRGCDIRDTGLNGIQLSKASPGADQPNKPANANLVAGNHIENAGLDGINVNSSSDNVITGNTVLNSSDDKASRDGIRISSSNGISCDRNELRDNTSTDNQAIKTQRYGLHISNSLCNANVIGTNNLEGNRVAPLRDVGTGTVYE